MAGACGRKRRRSEIKPFRADAKGMGDLFTRCLAQTHSVFLLGIGRAPCA